MDDQTDRFVGTIRVGPFTYTYHPYHRNDGHDWHREHNGHRNIANAEVSALVDVFAAQQATIISLEEQLVGPHERIEHLRLLVLRVGRHDEWCRLQVQGPPNKPNQCDCRISKELAALGEGE